MGLYIPLLYSLLTNQFKFNHIFRFIFLRVLSCSFISWVDSLELEVRCFLSLGDSLSGEVYILFSNLWGGFPCVASSWFLISWWIP